MSKDTLMEAFDNARHENVQSGAFKFSTEYVSYFELFKAAQAWAEDDDNVISLRLRPGGQHQISLDFAYDTTSLPEEDKMGKFEEAIVRPYFKERLGGDFLKYRDYGSTTYIVK